MGSPVVTAEVPVIDVLIPATNCWVLLVVVTVEVGIVADKDVFVFIENPELVKQPLSSLTFLVRALLIAAFKAIPSTVFLMVKTYVAEESNIGSKYSPVSLVSSPLTEILSYVM